MQKVPRRGDKQWLVIHCICEVVGHVPLFQINECGINIKIGGFRFVTACLSTHHAIGIRGLLCLKVKETWPSTRNSKRLVGFSSIGRSRLIGSRATRLSALSSLIRPLFPFLLGLPWFKWRGSSSSRCRISGILFSAFFSEYKQVVQVDPLGGTRLNLSILSSIEFELTGEVH